MGPLDVLSAYLKGQVSNELALSVVGYICKKDAAIQFQRLQFLANERGCHAHQGLKKCASNICHLICRTVWHFEPSRLKSPPLDP